MTKATRFNPDDVWPSPGFPFHHAVVEPEGRRVHVSGQVAWDLQFNVVGKSDAAAQTRFALASISRILKPLGGSLDDIVSVTVFYVDQNDYDAICTARKEVFSLAHGPASTAVRVAGLVEPELLVEIAAIAIIPHARYKNPA